MSVNISISGKAQTISYLLKKNKAVRKAVGDAIKQSGYFIEGEVKKSITGHSAEPRSVDTGRFLNNVTSFFPGEFIAKVSTNVSYAKHLEYGTSKMMARKHFRNTAKRNEKKVQDFVQKKIK